MDGMQQDMSDLESRRWRAAVLARPLINLASAADALRVRLELERNAAADRRASSDVTLLDQEILRVVRVQNNVRSALHDLQVDLQLLDVPDGRPEAGAPASLAA
jgi:hypothetical protein